MKLRALAIIVATLATSLFMAPASKASNWTLIYQTTSSQRNSSEYINYTAGYERNGAAQIATTGQNFSQVRWRMELTVGATAYYVDAYFDKWAGAPSASTVGISVASSAVYRTRSKVASSHAREIDDN